MILLEKIKNNKKKIGYSFIYCILCLMISLLYYQDINITKMPGVPIEKYKTVISIVYYLICISMSLAIFSIINLKKLKEMQLYKKFIIIAIIIGGFRLFFVPMLSGADELAHFCRIYEIAEGDMLTPLDKDTLLAKGNFLPQSIQELHDTAKGMYKYHDILRGLRIELNKNNSVEYGRYYITASLYSPIQYIPQAIGFFIGIHLNLNIYIIGLFGRIAGFLFWLVICSIAIKKVGDDNCFLFLLLLSPICIDFATVLSGDMMINSMVALLISYIYDFRVNKKEVKKQDIIVLEIISIIISLCKIVYFPIVFSLFLIPKECFKSKNKRFVFIIPTIILSIIMALVWYKVSSIYLKGEYDNSGEQIKYILYHPITYCITMIRTIFIYSSIYLTNSSQFQLYSLISIILWILVIIALLNNEKNKIKTENIFEKMLSGMIILGILVLIETALYIQFTAMTVSVGHFVVDGIQMRYFTPIIMMTLLLANKKRINIENVYIENCFLFCQLPIVLSIFEMYIS